MKKILMLLAFAMCSATSLFAQLAKVESLIKELEVPLVMLDRTPKQQKAKKIYNAIDAMKKIAVPTTVNVPNDLMKAKQSPNPLIGSKERELEQLNANIAEVEQQIEDVKAGQQQLRADSAKYFDQLADCEQLMLSLANDIFKKEYDLKNIEEAQNLLSYVQYDERKEHVAYLVNNYEQWMNDIEQILQNAEADFKSNPRAWKEIGGIGNGNTFKSKLDHCAYKLRKDQSWSIAFLDEYIKQAKERIDEYKDPKTQKVYLHFSDIADKAASRIVKK